MRWMITPMTLTPLLHQKSCFARSAIIVAPRVHRWVGWVELLYPYRDVLPPLELLVSEVPQTPKHHRLGPCSWLASTTL